jgi:glycosyltransferase-like protein LARGE
VYGLLKLTLVKILPYWVEKAIVLDTDVIFAKDISKLWNIFR